MQAANSLAGGNTADVLQAVAEQLKVPLTIIARQAELNQALGAAVQPDDLRAMHVQATTALTLVDCYLLGLALSQGQTQLELEPVSLSSMLTTAAHELYYLARQHNIELEVQTAGKYEPVMANHRGLHAALVSLGYGLLESNGQTQGRHRHLTLAAHRTPHGLVAGIYGDYEDLEAHEWRTALKLCGQASQPFTALCSGSGAGLFVADTILRSMTSQLRVGRRQKEAGLAATFQPSHQLMFV